MLTIDGSLGYGQVLRTAVALSSLTLQPVRIMNIRKGRPKPGLMAQHLMGVKVAGEFCSAEIKGLELYSTEVEFVPSEKSIPSYKLIDIGTAGNIPLLLQTLMPLLVFSDKAVTLEIIGGCAGLGAPTIEFLKHITLPILSKLGLPQPEVSVLKQGYYPRGQGKVKVSFKPVKKLKSIELTERGEVKVVRGISIAGSLPEHVAKRQSEAAKRVFIESGFSAEALEIESQTVRTASPGTSITLWAECEHSILGSDAIGERGVPAEKVGQVAAGELMQSINSGAALDKHMADQIIPFLALADGKSVVTVEDITEHCRTNIAVCEQMLGVKFEIEEKNRRIFVGGTTLR